ncbi:hypothetical protein HB664_16405 [Enterobacter sp. DNB-S2]|uniref:hypothetical protein n=1 Tax=Enterobacter sp. DNB-S2 TaxID=2720029 RepID=UPI001C62A1F8|nr:hypothetical protein [Enterobacter sp. DNB-S2]QYH17553.1 hypothetical protein HB664_16405 [Enterobacter sp. DNB-S2]
MSIHLKTCPACGMDLPTPELSKGDYFVYSCSKHGDFYIAGTVLEMLRKGNKTANKFIPALVEERAGKGFDGIITSYSFPTN